MVFPTTQENKEKLVKKLSLHPASAFSSLRFYSRASSFSTTFLGGRLPSKVSVDDCSFAAVSCPSTFYLQTPFFRNLSICLYSKTILVTLMLFPTISKTFGGKTCSYRLNSEADVCEQKSRRRL